MDKISIYNQALGRIGISLALTGENDSGVELTTCNRFYDSVLSEVLSAYPWRCVRSVKKLARVIDSDNPRADWQYCFVLPANYLSVIPDLMRANGFHDWEIAGDKIFANTSEITLYYTSTPDNPGVIAPHVVNCIVLKLAVKIAPLILKGGDDVLKSVLQEYESIELPRALALEVRESFKPSGKQRWVGGHK